MDNVNEYKFLSRLCFYSQEQGDKIALTAFDEENNEIQLTYAQLYALVKKISSYLTQNNLLQKGEHCIIACEGNLTSFVASLLAVNACGAIAVPVKPDFVDDEFNRCRFIAENCEAKLIIADKAFDDMQKMFSNIKVVSISKCLEKADTELREIEQPQNDVMMLLYTSGSTNMPKGIQIKESGLCELLAAYSLENARTSESVTLCCLPLHHVFALVTLLMTTLWAGGHTVLVRPEDFVVNSFLWFKCVSKYHVTHSGAPNYMLAMLAAAAEENADKISQTSLASLQSLILSTEFIQPDTVERFIKATANCGLNPNCLAGSYGLTETSSLITITKYCGGINKAYVLNDLGSAEYREGSEEILSVGAVLDGFDAVIADSFGKQLLTYGNVGEVCVRGPSVLENYYEAEESEDMYIYIDGKRYFRTGDFGFVLLSENDKKELYICGRQKEILNIRGENYSPHYIESIISSLTENVGTNIAVSVPKNDSEELFILIEEKHSLSESEQVKLCNKVSEALLKRISLLPTAVVFSKTGSFLKTESGKLKRNAMRNLYIAGKWSGTEVIPNLSIVQNEADTEVKDFIISFISRCLGKPVEIIDSEASMASLGVNSLLLQMLIGEINQRYGVRIAISVFNDYPTILALADYVSEQSAVDLNFSRKNNTADTFSFGDNIPLTPVQQAYLAGRNEEIDWGGVSCQYYIERDVIGLDTQRFINAVKLLMERHSSLRMIVMHDNTQQILDYAEPPVTVQRAINGGVDELLQSTANEMCYSMLPTDKPLFRIVLTEIDADLNKWRIHLQIDMLCCDAMSILVFWDDLKKLYDGINLPRLNTNFIQYAFGNSADEKKKISDRAYWLNKMRELPTAPQLSWNVKADKLSKGKFKRHQLFIDKEKWSAFEHLVQELEITPSVAFMTLFAEILSAFGAGSEFALSLTTLGRNMTEKNIYRVIGDFTKVMLFAVNRRDIPVIENARNIQEDLMSDLEHADYSSLDALRDPEFVDSVSDLYPIVFTSLLGMDTIVDTETPFSEKFISQSTTPQVVLDHQLLPADGGVIVCWDAIEEAFEDGFLESMFKAYSELIEKAQTRDFWFETLRDLRSVHDRVTQNKANDTAKKIAVTDMLSEFHRVAVQMPEQNAIIAPDAVYTYAQLQKRANQISELLRDNGIESGDRVMIQMPKSFDLIASIIGVVQMGAVYLPMPHDQPKNRQLDIYIKSKAKGIIAVNNIYTADEIPLFLVGDADDKAGEWTGRELSVDQLAYVIYTSGSTGAPKGVAITHGAAMNTISAVNEYLNLSDKDCLIGLSSVSFDLSVYDIFAALNVGATLLVPSEADRIDPARWLKLCREYRVTIWNTVPALMDIFLDYCISIGEMPVDLPIREVILSGDWIPMDLFDKMQKVLPHASLTSMGGATEASIWSNYFPVKEINENWVSIPYGYPLKNQFFHVLDEFGRPCPNGVSGKLHIGGAGLAQGYYNEPELTNNAFFTHNDTGERLYDTGDYGRYDENGCLIFMGRKDSQIKINGYRIELGEIQSALVKMGFADNAVIVADEGKSGKKLLAFVKTTQDFSESKVKKEISEYLPGYFVPDRIIPVDSFKMTANGKLDKKSLLERYKNENGNKGKASDDSSVLSKSDIAVIEVLCRELNISELTPNDSLAGLGVTSLSLIKLANRLETAFGHRAKVNDMIHYQKVGDFLDYYRNTSLSDINSKIQKENEKIKDEEKILAEQEPLYYHPVMQIMREELQTVSISQNDLFVNLGLSSLSVIRIANKLESEYGCRPSVHEMLRYQCVNDLIVYYENNKGKNMDVSEKSSVHNPYVQQNPVLACLSEMMNLPDITSNDSFSSLGVSSLEMIRIANKLEARYGYRPSMQELVQQTSFRQLIDYYDGAEIKENLNNIEDVERKRVINIYNRCKDADIVIWPDGDKLRFKAPQGALTPELKAELSENKNSLLEYLRQRSTVTGQELTPLQMAYVVGRRNQYVLGDITAHYYVEYKAESLDIAQLNDAVNEMIIKNEILRTVITPEGRMQVYTTNPGYQVEIVDCDGNGNPTRNLRDEMKNHQFPLGEWPMFDVKVTKTTDGKATVHIGIDCLILDGWSINMFMHQLISAYNGNVIKVTDYTFRCYLEEERRWLRNKQYYRDAKKYWEKQIYELPPAPRLPLKNELTEIKQPLFKRMQFELSPQLTFALFQRIKNYDMTPSLALCTAYMMSLSKWSSTPDVTLNLTMFNRQPIHEDVQQVLGDFTNIALIGYKAKNSCSFTEHTADVRKELWNAIEYRSYNVINLLGRLAEKHGDILAAPYVFTSLIDRESEDSDEMMTKAGFTEVFAQTQTPQVVLDHQLYLKNGKLILVLDYVSQAFDENMLSAMFKDYTDRVEKLAVNEDWENIYE